MKHNTEEISNLCRPLIGYLQNNCDLHTEIHINTEEIKLTSVELGIPIVSGVPVIVKASKKQRNTTELNKEDFLKTELGASLDECIKAWDIALQDKKKYWYETEEYRKSEKTANWCQAQWEVYKLMIKQFYGIEYNFTRTNEYFGLVTEDETDWLIKINRQTY